jgi:hypothetical protein
MGAQPGLQRVRAPVGQDVDPAAGLGVDQDRGVAVAAPQREVVDPEHPRDLERRQRQTQQAAQRGVPRQPHRQGGQHPSPGTARQFPHDRADLGRQARRPSLVTLQHARDLLPERLQAATSRAHKATNPHGHQHTARVQRHIRQRTNVVAVHPRRERTAPWTGSRRIRRPRLDPDPVTLIRHVLHDERRQPRKHQHQKTSRPNHDAS